MTHILTYSTEIQATPEQAYAAITQEARQKQWLCKNNRVRLIVGGSYFLDMGLHYAAGTFTALETNKRVAMTWHGGGESGDSEVVFEITPSGEGITVRVTHSGLNVNAEHYTTFWPLALEQLKYYLEKHQDLRVLQRPGLGIILEPLEAEQAKKLGVPVEHGILLNTVVPERSFANAGLQKDDVVVRFGAYDVPALPEFFAVIEQYRAGDTVTVTYYRGAQQHTAEVKLGVRAIPAPPATLAEMLAQMKQDYAAVDEERVALIAGVPDAQLSAQPAPKEWSVNEVLAHLLIYERFLHIYIWLTATEREPMDTGTNDAVHLAGVLATHPTAQAMHEGLSNCEREALAMIESLGEDYYAANQGAMSDIMGMVNGWIAHQREHFAQITRTLEQLSVKEINL